MMNMTRRESFTLDISFDCDIGELEDFSMSILQNGRSVITKHMRDAVIRDGGCGASIVLPGEETALLHPCEPAWVQVRATLRNGEEQHSEAYEINIVDVLDA